MNPEAKQAWVAALRSGEYQQGFGKLRDTKGYCCLGVLCDLALKAKVARDPMTNDLQSGWGRGHLPDAVQQWACLDESDPLVVGPYDSLTSSLGEINDSWDYDFDAIADIIEEQL